MEASSGTKWPEKYFIFVFIYIKFSLLFIKISTKQDAIKQANKTI